MLEGDERLSGSYEGFLFSLYGSKGGRRESRETGLAGIWDDAVTDKRKCLRLVCHRLNIII